MAIERKYQMIRLSAGDYLLPGNDGETIFRLTKYEDGPSFGLMDMAKDREFWRTMRWPKPRALLKGDQYGYDPLDDFDAWVGIGDGYDTRQEAIDRALRWEWERDNRMHGPERESKPIDFAALFARSATPSTSGEGD